MSDKASTGTGGTAPRFERPAAPRPARTQMKAAKAGEITPAPWAAYARSMASLIVRSY